MEKITKDNFDGFVVLLENLPNPNYPDLAIPRWWLDYGIEAGYLKEGDWYSQETEEGVRYFLRDCSLFKQRKISS